MNTNQNNSANNNNLNNANVNVNNLQDDTIVKMAHTNTRDIPVDVNSEVELHKRWNCSHSTAPDPVPNGGLFGGPQAMGPYANIHVIPTATNMIHYNLEVPIHLLVLLHNIQELIDPEIIIKQCQVYTGIVILTQ